MQPTVRSLDELMSMTNSIYDPQKQAINQQITQAGAQLPELEQGLYAAKDRAFKDISQLASNKGMLFSGFAPEQQARFTGEKFLPALTGLRSKVQDNIARLQGALLGLDTEQRKGAMSTREQDLGQLYNWNQEQDRRKYEQEQSKIAYERELQKLRESASLRNNAQSGQGIEVKKNAAGGWDVLEDGKASSRYDLAGYARATGKNVVSLLMQGDAEDRRAAQWYMDKISKYGPADADKYLLELMRDRPTAFYLGG